jgi:acyl-CoA thioester hydrolase
MQPFITRICVQQSDTDQLGQVSYSTYQQYLEQTTTAHWRSLGLTAEHCASMGGVFVMHRIEIEYFKAALAGDLLDVTTWVVEMRGACATRRYEIRRAGEKQLLLSAEALWVWIDAQTLRPRSIPAILQEAFGDLAVVCR